MVAIVLATGFLYPDLASSSCRTSPPPSSPSTATGSIPDESYACRRDHPQRSGAGGARSEEHTTGGGAGR
jgi:hypothetical protein